MKLLKENMRFRILFIADVFLLMIVIILQAAFINYIIMKQLKNFVNLCIFIVLDILLLGIVVKTFIISYHYFSQKRDDFLDGKKWSFLKLNSYKIGTLPMSYITWFLYIGILVTKLALLFIRLNPYEVNPQELQVCIAVSTIVFMLLVEGHNWHKKSSEDYSYVTDVCKKNGIEIFDSVEMLELLFTPDKLSTELKIIIFGLAAFNFVLPTLSLYRLSLSNFGHRSTPLCYPLKIFQNILRFVFVDVPFFIVRLDIWIRHQDLSMFMMKNLFNMVMSVRELYIDVCVYFKHTKLDGKSNQNENENILLSDTQTQTDGSKKHNNV